MKFKLRNINSLVCVCLCMCVCVCLFVYSICINYYIITYVYHTAWLSWLVCIVLVSLYHMYIIMLRVLNKLETWYPYKKVTGRKEGRGIRNLIQTNRFNTKVIQVIYRRSVLHGFHPRLFDVPWLRNVYIDPMLDWFDIKEWLDLCYNVWVGWR